MAGVTFEDPLPLFVYPWSNSDTSKKDPRHSRFCGPSTNRFVEEEFRRTISLYEEIKSQGYTPRKYPHSMISGTFLISSNGQKRFIVMQGNHRMAILSHLGLEKIIVRASSWNSAFVREEELCSWPNVKNARCSVEHAEKVFNYFFMENGNRFPKLIN